MPVTKSFQNSGAIKDSQCTVAIFHLQEQAGSSRASDVERLVASLVSTLYASAHSLMAKITGELPPSLWYLFNIHDWLHECMIAK
jgi:hypothetical protein